MFVTSVVDNIDHNLSSNTAASSFHGTSISIFQHPDGSIQHPPFAFVSENTSTRVDKLPSLYTEIKLTKGRNPEPLELRISLYEFPSQHDVASKASDWLQKLEGPAGPIEERISFAAFHCKMATAVSSKSVSQLLPLFSDSANTPATVRHCAFVIKSITERLNPDQIPVITADKLVYALGKQVQWKYPEELGNIIWMMGPVHTEMLLLSMIEDWLAGSG